MKKVKLSELLAAIGDKTKVADLVRKVKVGASTYYLKEGDTPARVIKLSSATDSGDIDFTSIDLVSIRLSDRSIDNTLETGDILISTRSSTPKILVVPEEANGFYFTSEFFALSLKPGIILPEVLCAYLTTPQVLHYLTKRSGDRKLATISRDDVLALEIDIPSREEQDRLAELAHLIKEKYAVMEKEKRCLEALQTNMFSSFVGGVEKC